MLPFDFSASDFLAKLLILLPCSRHDRYKQSAPPTDLFEVFLGSQFAVGDVNEVGLAKKFLESPVVVRMQSVVGLVAIVDSMRQRYSTVRRYRHSKDQLLAHEFN